jgi:RND family efflux transporter MFP subunit
MIRILLSLLLLTVLTTAGAEQTSLVTEPAMKSTVPVVYQAHGFIEAVNKATMKAETSGRIAAINFDVDDIVSKGEIIAQFRNKRQKAELDLALAGLEEVKAELSRAQSDYDRYQDLFEQKLVAKTVLDKANADLKAAKARMDAAQARIKSAREEYENTIIRAPYSGIVTQRHVEVGEAVNPGSPLVSGISLNLIRAVVDVPQNFVDPIRRNHRAIIYLPDGEQLSSDKITVFPYADEKSHTFRVRVELPQGVEGLYPGMTVKLGFVVSEESVLMVPESALVSRGEITAVYVKDAQRGVVMRQVRAGETIKGTGTVILAGLDENEQVYLDPLAATVALKQQKQKTEE